MNVFLILVIFLSFFQLVWAETGPSERRREFIELRIKEAYLLNDVEAYSLIAGPLGEAGGDRSIDGSETYPQYPDLYQKIQELLEDRTGFVVPVIDRVIAAHLKAHRLVRKHGVSHRESSQAIFELRQSLKGSEVWALKNLEHPEVIGQLARLLELPQWTEDEFIALEAPGDYGNTYADAILLGTRYLRVLVVQDDRYRRIYDEVKLTHKGRGFRAEVWRRWTEGILKGEESFRFRKDGPLIGGGGSSGGGGHKARSRQPRPSTTGQEQAPASGLSPALQMLLLSLMVALGAGLLFHLIRRKYAAEREG